MHNYIRTFLLLAAMTAIFVGAGYLLGGTGGMAIAFVVALGTNLFAYWNSGKMALRMYKAREIQRQDMPGYYDTVARLAEKAHMPMPRVYLIDNDQPNAFATGRSPEHASVAATSGLLAMLNDREVAGVMAHELAHIQNRDTLTMTVTATIAGAISMLANIGLFSGGRGRGGALAGIAVAILAPLAAMLVQMAISRTREYSADAGGAAISGDPEALASALQKIDAYAQKIRNPEAERNPASAQMFIINPLGALRRDKMFSTHPATANRIAKLRELAHQAPTSSMEPPSSGRREAQSSIRKGPWG